MIRKILNFLKRHKHEKILQPRVYVLKTKNGVIEVKKGTVRVTTIDYVNVTACWAKDAKPSVPYHKRTIHNVEGMVIDIPQGVFDMYKQKDINEQNTKNKIQTNMRSLR